ncbi:SIS domain-containing protein [Bryobacter aggregatus]|uniref:SIS domain-containing protein n=1 Tax=Bryobacter aggregatus TaxID=360054 RepID=UPI0004E22486|nr:SIS domain-containing protein [Bryobacter aggregatus]
MSKMLEEIRQQPEALSKTLQQEWKGIEKLKKQFEAYPPRLIVLAARGTSDNAAQFGRYLLELLTGIPVSLAAPSIYTLYDRKMNLEDTLVVAISQSGESTDTNLVLERAKENGAFTLGITNEANSTLAKLGHASILVRAGKEKSVAATKTYTGQLMAMYLLAYALGAKLERKQLETLPGLAEKALKLEPQVAEIAGRYRFMNHAVVVGRGLNYANAFEFALKMMETCYVIAERFSSADLLHGPIAMVDPHFPAFVFAPSGVTWDSISQLLTRIDSTTHESLIITDKSNKAAFESKRRAFRIQASIPELFSPIPYIIPGQLFAGYLATEKGLNPDQPRSLTKVTQTL